MSSSWLSLLLWSTCVSAFYPYQPEGTSYGRKRFIPIKPPQDIPPVVTADIRRLPKKRDNTYNVVLSNTPSAPNAVAINEDGSDFSYFSTFSFGSKGQKMYMLIDSGSANTWVMAEDCKSDACKVHNTFGPDYSTTLNRTTTPWSITYGTGTVSGVLASDSVAFASYNLQLGFGLATSASDDFNNYPMDGILGLGRAASSELNTPPLMEVLKSKGLISQKLIGIHLQRNSDNLKDGVLTFGDVDKTKFTGSLNYVNTINANGWEVVADDASVDGKACNFKGKSAIIDTGTSYILMPPSDAAVLHNLIPGSTRNIEQFTVPCGSTAMVQLSMGGVVYNVLPKDYVGKAATGGSCYSNIIGHQAFGPDQWILGDTFLKNVYVAFDFEKGRIGFGTQGAATSTLTSSSSSSSSSSSTSSSPSSSSSSSSGLTSNNSSSASPTSSSPNSSSTGTTTGSNPPTTTTGSGRDSSPFGSPTGSAASSFHAIMSTMVLAFGASLMVLWGII